MKSGEVVAEGSSGRKGADKVIAAGVKVNGSEAGAMHAEETGRGNKAGSGAGNEAEDKPPVPSDFLLLDCGDYSNNETDSKFIQSRYTARSYSLLCYDAVNIGKREISLPQDRLSEMLAEFGNVPVVSANVRFTAPLDGADYSAALNEMVRPFVRVRLDNGARVVVTGVVTADALPHNLAQCLGVVVEPVAGAIAAVKKQVKRGEQLVVLVSELSEEETAAVIEMGGVVSVGHRPAHFKLLREKLKDAPETAAIPAGEDRGRSVGRALVEFGGDTPATVHEVAFDPLPKGMEKHPLIVELLEDMSAEVTEYHRALHAELMGRDLDTVVDYTGRTACAECHEQIYAEYMKTRHAFAVTTLVDIDESRNGLCLPCHTTGYGEVTGFSVAGRSEGLDSVGCEQCHGPGEVHIQMMREAETTGPLDGLDSYGLRKVREDRCRRCHVENTDPDFDFSAKLKLVAHGDAAEQQQ